MRKARLLLGLAALAGSAWFALGRNVVWLSDASDARWIVPREPFRLGARAAGPREAVFRKGFELPASSSPALSLKALKLARVFVDGRAVYADADPAAWRNEKAVSLGELAAGRHELKVAVLDVDGPDALLARSATPGLATDQSWEASRDDTAWAPAAAAVDGVVPELSEAFGGPARALRSTWPVLAAVFTLVFAWSWSGRPRFPVSAVRWLCAAAWIVLWARDAPRLGLGVGFDVKGHLEYMSFLLARHALPTPADGWQTFQAPLYYVLSLPAFAASLNFGEAAGRVLLRLIPLLCGLAQIELSYRAARRLFPDRKDLHAAAVVLGGLMPMGLYLDLGLGNEPLAAALTAGALVAALSENAVWAGAALGLALLTKASALLAVIPIGVFLGRGRKGRKQAGLALGVAALIAGWFYLRQWALTGSLATFSSYGRVALGGGGGGWWQDPGYRAWPQLVSFGRALRRPIFAATAGFWDSLYSTAWLDGLMSSVTTFDARPPWNLGFLLALSWLSLVPCALILVGLARGARRKPFALIGGTLALYLAAVLALWLRFPIYSIAKATYTAGLIPFYAVLGCLGLESLATGRLSRALARGWLAAWAACSWLAFFIR